MSRVAEKFAKEKPSTLIWCMGQTQHTVGTANVRASCIALLLTGQRGRDGHRRQHLPRPLQRAGRHRSRPRYLDAAPLLRPHGGAWKHWARVWDVDTSGSRPLRRGAAKGGRKPRTRKENMETPGHHLDPVVRRVLLPEDQVDQRSLIAAMVVFGHGGNTVTRMPEAAKGLEKLDLLVVADPHPTSYAQMSERKNNTYPLPICTNFETDGSRTASNRRCNGASRS
jgi:formate dehydrogenase major subunit